MSHKRRMRAAEVAAALRAEIISGGAAPGTPLLSSKKLAEKHGVSLLTANKAINSLAAEGLLYRIHGSGTYVADKASGAKTLKVGLGCVVPAIDCPEVETAFAVFSKTIAAALGAGGCRVRSVTPDEISDPDWHSREASGFNGFILSMSHINSVSTPLLQASGKPVVVFLADEVQNIPFHQVVPDALAGYSSAVSELLRGRPANSGVILASLHKSAARRGIFMEAARSFAGGPAPVTEELVDKEAGDLGRLAGRKLGAEIFGKYKNPAVFVTSDFIAFGIIDAALERGLRPGKDFRLAGYDDLEGDGLLPFGKPLVSSVSYPKKEIAQCAAGLAMDMIKQKETRRRHIIIVPVSLSSRNSTRGGDR
jgi:DNA-binding LacI/PurR family transcriptional regulator